MTRDIRLARFWREAEFPDNPDHSLTPEQPRQDERRAKDSEARADGDDDKSSVESETQTPRAMTGQQTSDEQSDHEASDQNEDSSDCLKEPGPPRNDDCREDAPSQKHSSNSADRQKHGEKAEAHPQTRQSSKSDSASRDSERTSADASPDPASPKTRNSSPSEQSEADIKPRSKSNQTGRTTSVSRSPNDVLLAQLPSEARTHTAPPHDNPSPGTPERCPHQAHPNDETTSLGQAEKQTPATPNNESRPPCPSVKSIKQDSRRPGDEQHAAQTEERSFADGEETGKPDDSYASAGNAGTSSGQATAASISEPEREADRDTGNKPDGSSGPAASDAQGVYLDNPTATAGSKADQAVDRAPSPPGSSQDDGNPQSKHDDERKRDGDAELPSSTDRPPPAHWETAAQAAASTSIEQMGKRQPAGRQLGIDPARMKLRDHLGAKTARDNAFAAAVQAGMPVDRPTSLIPPAALLRLEDPFAGQGQDHNLASTLNSRLAGAPRNAPRSAFELTPEQHTLRRMQMMFARIVAKLAEDFAGLPTAGDEEWDIDALISRSMDKRTLQACRLSHERESLIVVMDVSGSCRHHAEFFQRVSALATSHNDVELMSGNNGRIEAWWRAATSTWCPVTCGRWPFRHRTILFFGDHDGEAIIADASQRNRITWFSNETRAGRCEQEPPHFHGWYVRCGDDADLVRVARRLR